MRSNNVTLSLVSTENAHEEKYNACPISYQRPFLPIKFQIGNTPRYEPCVYEFSQLIRHILQEINLNKPQLSSPLRNPLGELLFLKDHPGRTELEKVDIDDAVNMLEEVVEKNIFINHLPALEQRIVSAIHNFDSPSLSQEAKEALILKLNNLNQAIQANIHWPYPEYANSYNTYYLPMILSLSISIVMILPMVLSLPLDTYALLEIIPYLTIVSPLSTMGLLKCSGMTWKATLPAAMWGAAPSTIGWVLDEALASEKVNDTVRASTYIGVTTALAGTAIISNCARSYHDSMEVAHKVYRFPSKVYKAATQLMSYAGSFFNCRHRRPIARLRETERQADIEILSP